jgi:hypothetical protein
MIERRALHTRISAAALACSLAACGAPHEPPRAPTKPPAVVTKGTASVKDAPLPPIACTEPASSEPLAKLRSDGIDALVAGDARKAARRLTELLAKEPNDVAAAVLREAAVHDLDQLHANDSRVYASLEAKTVTGILQGPKLVREVKLPKTQAPTLSVRPLGKYLPPRPDLDPDALLDGQAGGFSAQLRGEGITRAFPHDDHRLALFGDHALGLTRTDRSKPLLLELSPLVTYGSSEHLHAVHGAQIVGRTLVVGLGRPSVMGATADSGYLAAIDLDALEILWVSEPSTSNAPSFVVSGSYAITAFGVSGQKGSMSVIDLSNGRTTSRVELPSSPGMLAVEGGQLRVTPDDYTRDSMLVDLSTGLVPAAKADITVEDLDPAPRAPEGAACVLRRVASAIDRRDPNAARAELAALGHQVPSAELALEGAVTFLARAASGDQAVVDLSTPAPVAAKPGFFDPVKTPSTAERSHLPRPPTLRQRRVEKYQVPLEGDVPTVMPQTAKGVSPMAPPVQPASNPSVSFSVPETYGIAGFSSSLALGDLSLLVYGQRYVAALDGHRTRAILDLGEGPYGLGIIQLGANDTTLFASIVGDGPIGPAPNDRSIAAFDLATGARKWRTDPGVAAAGFVRAGDYLLAASGAGQEKPAIVVVRTDDGEVVGRIALRSAPRQLTFLPDASGKGELVVACAGEIVTYDVSP